MSIRIIHPLTLITLLIIVSSAYSASGMRAHPGYTRPFEAKDFFEKVVGISEQKFRDELGWDTKKGFLQKLAHLKTSKEFNAWKEKWIKDYPQRAAIFAGKYDFQTVEKLNSFIDFSHMKPLGKAKFIIQLYDPAHPKRSSIARTQADPNNNDTVFQLASTFFGPLEGGMEDPARYLTEMLKHPVQGEWGSISAAGATIYRKYFMPTENWIKRQEGISQDPNYFYLLYNLRDKAPRAKPYRNEWPDWRIDLNALKHYKFDPLDKLKVGIFTHADIAVTSQEAERHAPADARETLLYNIPFNGKHRITQVLNSAYDLNRYYKEILAGGKENTNVIDFAQMILSGMYEGTIKSAYVHGKKNVHLTLLGGGAFLNDIAWITDVFVKMKYDKSKNSEYIIYNPIVGFIKKAGLMITISYRPDKKRTIPVRTATGDIEFLKYMYLIADEVSGTREAQAIINSPEMQAYFKYIENHYEKITGSKGAHTIPSRHLPQEAQRPQIQPTLQKKALHPRNRPQSLQVTKKRLGLRKKGRVAPPRKKAPRKKASSSRRALLYKKAYYKKYPGEKTPKRSLKYAYKTPMYTAKTDIIDQTSLKGQFAQLVNQSDTFNNKIVKFPTSANRINKITAGDPAIQKQIEWQAHHVRPILHAKVLQLIDTFLEYKKTFGTNIEKKIYDTMNRSSFVNRLLTQRPLMFMNPQDQYLLRSGSEGKGGFEAIGTDHEKAPFLLRDYLSYDEMQIAAFIGVSVPTYFINNGDRHNKGEPNYQNKPYQKTGIFTGLVGARFEKPGYMEWQHMMITQEQNSPNNGYGNLANPSKQSKLKPWAEFYGMRYFPSFEEAQHDKTGRYLSLGDNYLDTYVYKERLKMVILPFLVDANQRGKDAKKQVYCHVVGLGTGAWAVNALEQEKLMLEVYANILKSHRFEHISDINFSYFKPEEIDGIKNGGAIKTNGNSITVHFSKRNTADKLTGKDADKLLAAMYAWDGNAYPGNEYWVGSLSASGDPAAASCSTIPELQNPLVNPAVSSKNIFVAK